jgi:hypothetical protein
MFPFSLFKKKKKEIPLEENSLSTERDSSIQNNFSGVDKEDLILSKIETINAKLDNINERLKKIEEIANS